MDQWLSARSLKLCSLDSNLDSAAYCVTLGRYLNLSVPHAHQ